jgi:hypothetical protein
VYRDTPFDQGGSVADFFLPREIALLDHTVTTMSVVDLADDELAVLEDLSAGYSMQTMEEV